MSAKVLIKKEDLIKGAIKIIRDKGDNELSARNLARTCNCSTQPIFRLFENMEDLKIYKEDPRHVELSKLCKSIREERGAVDFIF